MRARSGSKDGQKGVGLGPVWDRFRVGFFGVQTAEAPAGPGIAGEAVRITFFCARCPRMPRNASVLPATEACETNPNEPNENAPKTFAASCKRGSGAKQRDRG